MDNRALAEAKGGEEELGEGILSRGPACAEARRQGKALHAPRTTNV